jgi:hypothetical protein
MAAMTADLTVLLNEGLLGRGYAIERTQESPEAFGSWYRDYTRGDQRLRLVWDGRDQWFVLQGAQRDADQLPKQL